MEIAFPESCGRYHWGLAKYVEISNLYLPGNPQLLNRLRRAGLNYLGLDYIQI